MIEADEERRSSPKVSFAPGFRPGLAIVVVVFLIVVLLGVGAALGGTPASSESPSAADPSAMSLGGGDPNNGEGPALANNVLGVTGQPRDPLQPGASGTEGSSQPSQGNGATPVATARGPVAPAATSGRTPAKTPVRTPVPTPSPTRTPTPTLSTCTAKVVNFDSDVTIYRANGSNSGWLPEYHRQIYAARPNFSVTVKRTVEHHVYNNWWVLTSAYPGYWVMYGDTDWKVTC